MINFKIRIAGDQLDVNEHFIVVINHQANVDWIFVSSALLQAQWPTIGKGAKYILKDVVRHYPGGGSTKSNFYKLNS